MAKYFRVIKSENPPQHSVLSVLDRGEATVNQAVNDIRKETGVSESGAVRCLYSSLEEKKATIVDESPPSNLWHYLRSPYSSWFWGVGASMVLVVFAIYFFPSSAPLIYLRYVFGSLMVLFIPGYTLIETLYPNKKDLDGLERLALSIGLSLALVPLVGLVLNYTPWGIRLDPIVFSLVALSLVLAISAAFRKASYLSLSKKGAQSRQ